MVTIYHKSFYKDCYSYNIYKIGDQHINKLTDNDFNKLYTNHFPKSYLPIMLALCLILSTTYYAQNYASIIGLGLVCIMYSYIMAIVVKLHDHIATVFM